MRNTLSLPGGWVCQQKRATCYNKLLAWLEHIWVHYLIATCARSWRSFPKGVIKESGLKEQFPPHCQLAFALNRKIYNYYFKVFSIFIQFLSLPFFFFPTLLLVLSLLGYYSLLTQKSSYYPQIYFIAVASFHGDLPKTELCLPGESKPPTSI